MKDFVGIIVSFLCSFVNTRNVICFSSFPDYSDNAYGIYRYLIEKGLNKTYEFVWVVSDKTRMTEIQHDVSNDGLNIQAIYKYSLKGIWTYVIARYVFETHGMFPALKLKQHIDKHICLWHGMPQKKIGASLKDACSPNCNYTIATSKMFQNIMAEAFDITTDRVLLTGMPRCDLLFEKTDWFDKVGIDVSKYSKVGIWMPTYRKSVVGEIRQDGNYDEHAVSFLKEKEMKRLDVLLKEENILLLLKIHPMDALQNVSFDSYSNIILIRPHDFHSQLYPLLGSCDFLLTDYSSVFIDYQMLHRPIGFVMNDVELYRNSRGLYFEELPGPILSTYESLVEFLRNMYTIDCGMNFNEFYDNKASERLCAFLNLA